MILVFRLMAVLGLLALTSCPKPEPVQPVGPDGELSDIPWNRPSAGEGAGALQQAINPY